MQRFQTGEEVLVNKFMGELCDPPRSGVVRRVYGTSSLLFDYLIQVGATEYSVRDDWLVPVSITISEALEWPDL
jgi:hypothetical protein